MNRLEVTEKIISTKVAKGIRWADVAKKVGQSKEWTTALCLGQMTASPEQAKILGKIFGLNAEEQKWLQVVPYKGSLPTAVPTDPLIYRFYELVSVYGTTFKELIHEEFGDGIMSAIDFKMDLQREPDPKGDRVRIVHDGAGFVYVADYSNGCIRKIDAASGVVTTFAGGGFCMSRTTAATRRSRSSVASMTNELKMRTCVTMVVMPTITITLPACAM